MWNLNCTFGLLVQIDEIAFTLGKVIINCNEKANAMQHVAIRSHQTLTNAQATNNVKVA